MDAENREQARPRAPCSTGYVDGAIEVLLVHPAGNYNRRAPWGIPKGAPDPDEELEATARRETLRGDRPRCRRAARSISASSTTRARRSAFTRTPGRRPTARRRAARRGKSTRPSSSRSPARAGSSTPIRPRCSIVSSVTSVRATTTQVPRRPQPPARQLRGRTPAAWRRASWPTPTAPSRALRARRRLAAVGARARSVVRRVRMPIAVHPTDEDTLYLVRPDGYIAFRSCPADRSALAHTPTRRSAERRRDPAGYRARRIDGAHRYPSRRRSHQAGDAGGRDKREAGDRALRVRTGGAVDGPPAVPAGLTPREPVRSDEESSNGRGHRAAVPA